MPKNNPRRGDEERRAIEQSAADAQKDPKAKKPGGPSSFPDIHGAAVGDTSQRTPSDPTNPDSQWQSGTGDTKDPLGAGEDELKLKQLHPGKKGYATPANVDPLEVMPDDGPETATDVTDARAAAAAKEARFAEKNEHYIAYKIWRPPFDFFASDYSTRRDFEPSPDEGASSTAPTQTESKVVYDSEICLIAEAIDDDDADLFADPDAAERALRQYESDKDIDQFRGTSSMDPLMAERERLQARLRELEDDDPASAPIERRIGELDELLGPEHGGGYQFDRTRRGGEFATPGLGEKGDLDISNMAYGELNPSSMVGLLGVEGAQEIYANFLVHDSRQDGGVVPLLQNSGDVIVAVDGYSTTHLDPKEKNLKKPAMKQTRPRPELLSRGIKPEMIRNLEGVKDKSDQELDAAHMWGDKNDVARIAEFVQRILSNLELSDNPEKVFAARWEKFKDLPQADEIKDLLSKLFVWQWDDPVVLLRDIQAISDPKEMRARKRRWQEQQVEKGYLDQIVPTPDPEEVVGSIISMPSKHGPVKFEILGFDPHAGTYAAREVDGSGAEVELTASDVGAQIGDTFDHAENARGNPWPLQYAETNWQKEKLREKAYGEEEDDSDAAVKQLLRAKDREAEKAVADKTKDDEAVRLAARAGDAKTASVKDRMISGPEELDDYDDAERRVEVTDPYSGDKKKGYVQVERDGLYEIRFDDGSVEKLDADEFEFIDDEEVFGDDVVASDLPPLSEDEDDTTNLLQGLASQPEEDPERRKRQILYNAGKPVVDAGGGEEQDPRDRIRTLYYIPDTGHELSDELGGRQAVIGMSNKGTGSERVWRVAYSDKELGPATMDPETDLGLMAVTKNPDWRPKEKARVSGSGKVTGLPRHMSRATTIGKARVREYTATPITHSGTGATATSQGAGGAEAYRGRLDELLEVMGTTAMVTVMRVPNPDLEKELIALNYPNPRGPYYEVCEAQYIGMKSQDEEFKDWDPKITEWTTGLKRAWYLYDLARGKLENAEDLTLATREIPLWKRRKQPKPGESIWYKKPVMRTARWKGADPEEKLGASAASWKNLDSHSDLDTTEFMGLEGREAAEAMLAASDQLLVDIGSDIYEHFARIAISTDPDVSRGAKQAAENVATFVIDILKSDESIDYEAMADLMAGGQNWENNRDAEDIKEKGTRPDGSTQLRWDHDNFRIPALMARLFNIGLAEVGEGVGRWTKHRGYQHDPGRSRVRPVDSIIKEVSRPRFSGVSARSPEKFGQATQRTPGRTVGHGTYMAKNRDPARYYGPGRSESVEARDAIIEVLEHSVRLKQGSEAAEAFGSLARADISESLTDGSLVLLYGFKGDEKVLNGLTARVVEHFGDLITVDIVDTPRASIIHEDDRQIVVAHDEAIVIKR